MTSKMDLGVFKSVFVQWIVRVTNDLIKLNLRGIHAPL